MTSALAGHATEQRIADYLDPWTDSRVRRSWLAMAGASDSRYTLDLLPALKQSTTPKLLIWGEDDAFETVGVRREVRLVRIPEPDHIPTENAPDRIARALAGFFAA